MEIRNSEKSSGQQLKQTLLPNFLLWIFNVALFLIVGCGAPGEPQPPQAPVPAPIADLSAQQSGDGVALTFTAARETPGGVLLPEPPAIEIYRSAAHPDGSADEKSFRLVYTIPGALAETYMQGDRVRFVDPIPPEEIRAHPGETLFYRVRARVSQKRASADSNTVSVRIFPVPEGIPGVQARVTETAIELDWPEPQRSSAGAAVPSISGYRIYRGELDPATIEAAQTDFSRAKWRKLVTLLAPSPTNHFRDTQFEFGIAYAYVVRSVITADGNPVESGDSVAAIVTPRDTFPPAAPQGLVAVYVTPGASPEPRVELSWSISVETDLAGYRVYRSEQEGARGQLLTPDLLPAPAFRDISVDVGHRYWYTVTAVDRAGNESAPSAAVTVDVTQPSS